MEQQATNQDEKEPPNAITALPKSWARGIIVFMLGSVFLGAIPAIAPQLAFLKEINFWWRTGIVGTVGIASLILATGLICAKQLGYYYLGWGHGSKNGVFQTIRAYSNLEFVLDVLLGIFGAFLWPVAWYYTPAWLLTFSWYCLVALYRCNLTLQRPLIASTETVFPNSTIQRTRFYGRGLPQNPSTTAIADHLTMVSKSLETKHNGIPVKYILAGWVWSFRTYAVLSASFFCISYALHIVGKTSASIGIALFGTALTVVLFATMSDFTLRWGTEFADSIIERLRLRKKQPIATIAICLFLLGGVIMLAGRPLLGYFVSYKVAKQEKSIGVTLRPNWYAPGITQGVVVSYMTPVWKNPHFEAQGNNYWTIGWFEDQQPGRFNPDSPYYQAWFGGYIAKSDSFAGLPDNPDAVPMNVISELAVLDQKAWLKLYGDSNPTAELVRWEPRGTLEIDGHRGLLFYGEIASHADVSEQTTQYVELFPVASGEHK